MEVGGAGANVGATMVGSGFFSGTLRIAVTGLDSIVITGANGVGTSTFSGGFTGAGGGVCCGQVKAVLMLISL